MRDQPSFQEQAKIRHTYEKECLPIGRRIPKKILAHTNIWAIGATLFDTLIIEKITHCLKKGHKGVKDDVYETMMKVSKNGRLVK